MFCTRFDFGSGILKFEVAGPFLLSQQFEAGFEEFTFFEPGVGDPTRICLS